MAQQTLRCGSSSGLASTGQRQPLSCYEVRAKDYESTSNNDLKPLLSPSLCYDAIESLQILNTSTTVDWDVDTCQESGLVAAKVSASISDVLWRAPSP